MRTTLPTLFLAAATILSMVGISLFIVEKLRTARNSFAMRGTLGNAQSIPVKLDR